MASGEVVRLCLSEPCRDYVDAPVERVCEALRTDGAVELAEGVVEDHPALRGERVWTLLEWDPGKGALTVYWEGEDRGYIEGYEVVITREILENAIAVCGRPLLDCIDC